MSDHDCKQPYEETFYIIPRNIRKLPKITLAYLDVYETIFQFWNKRLPCFLSNAKLQERTGLGHTVINDALKFFEEHGELERKIKNGKRFFVQPLRYIETDPPSATAEPPSRNCGTPPSASAVHNIKNKSNKEPVVVGEQPTQQSQKEKTETEALNDKDNIELFNKKFSNRDVTLEQIFKACQEYNAPKNRWVGTQLFNKWLHHENPDNYTKKGSHTAEAKSQNEFISSGDNALLQDYKAWLTGHSKRVSLETWFPNEEKRNRAVTLYAQEQEFLRSKNVSN